MVVRVTSEPLKSKALGGILVNKILKIMNNLTNGIRVMKKEKNTFPRSHKGSFFFVDCIIS